MTIFCWLQNFDDQPMQCQGGGIEPSELEFESEPAFHCEFKDGTGPILTGKRLGNGIFVKYTRWGKTDHGFLHILRPKRYVIRTNTLLVAYVEFDFGGEWASVQWIPDSNSNTFICKGKGLNKRGASGNYSLPTNGDVFSDIISSAPYFGNNGKIYIQRSCCHSASNEKYFAVSLQIISGQICWPQRPASRRRFLIVTICFSFKYLSNLM